MNGKKSEGMVCWIMRMMEGSENIWFVVFRSGKEWNRVERDETEREKNEIITIKMWEGVGRSGRK